MMALHVENMKSGCGVLFMLDNGSGIIICGQTRADGNKFLCKSCLSSPEKYLMKQAKRI